MLANRHSDMCHAVRQFPKQPCSDDASKERKGGVTGCFIFWKASFNEGSDGFGPKDFNKGDVLQDRVQYTG